MLARKTKSVVYLHPANEGPQGAGGTGKRSCTDQKKRKAKKFQKHFADRKKVVCLQPQKTATFWAERFIERVCFGKRFGRRKKLSEKNFQKHLAEPKKGCIFAPA